MLDPAHETAPRATSHLNIEVALLCAIFHFVGFHEHPFDFLSFPFLVFLLPSFFKLRMKNQFAVEYGCVLTLVTASHKNMGFLMFTSITIDIKL